MNPETVERLAGELLPTALCSRVVIGGIDYVRVSCTDGTVFEVPSDETRDDDYGEDDDEE